MGVKQQLYSFYTWEVHIWHEVVLLRMHAIIFCRLILSANLTASSPSAGPPQLLSLLHREESGFMVNNIISPAGRSVVEGDRQGGVRTKRILEHSSLFLKVPVVLVFPT